MCALVLAAIRCVEEQVVAEPWMVDLGMVLGTGFAPFRGGPLYMADDYGLDRLVLDLEELQRTCGPRFSPCELLREMRSRGVAILSGTGRAGRAERIRNNLESSKVRMTETPGHD